MDISIIVGMGNQQEIGANNQIPWHLSADLKYFKKVTLGHPIIMGRKCYESIGRALPGRQNIVITRNPDFEASDCIIAHSLPGSLTIAKESNPDEIFIIGGGQIYEEALTIANKLYITYIDIDVPDADIFFPSFSLEGWECIKKEVHQKDEKNQFDYTFAVYQRN